MQKAFSRLLSKELLNSPFIIGKSHFRLYSSLQLCLYNENINKLRKNDSSSKIFSSNFKSFNNLKFYSNARSRKGNKNVNLDSFGAWDDFELPLQMEVSIQHGKPIPKVSAEGVGAASHFGKRTYQDDRYFIKDLNENLLCCAIFDGHSGSECSAFCEKNIEEVLHSELKKNSDYETVIHHTILELHSRYAAWAKEWQKGLTSGSTACVCLLHDSVTLYVGHVGDSRALLCRRGKPRRLTYDHCPSNLAERNRILQSGGRVMTDSIGRHMVDGRLNMSRSVGDIHLKRLGVIALPDTKYLKMKHSDDAFLLLTSDGINFVLNDDEICRVVNYAKDPKSAADMLVEQAVGMSAEDNVTAVVVPLGAWGNFAKSASSMFFSFGIGRDMNKSSRFG